MNSFELYALLEIPAVVVAKLDPMGTVLPMEELEPYLDGMMAGETAAATYEELKAFLQADEGCFKMLWCQLECARRCHERYRACGIPEPVFVDTMKCFQRFLHECEKRTGEMYFDRGWWTYRQISMRLFRVGQLEYELCSAGAEKTVSVHIPSDAVFTPANVDESLEQAKHFIERYFPDYRDAKRVCSSWLLSPQLGELLPEQSNIRGFQRRFQILEEYPDDRDFLEWLFQASKDAEVSDLPEATRLQRAAKKLLLSGKTIGAAYGIMI